MDHHHDHHRDHYKSAEWEQIPNRQDQGGAGEGVKGADPMPNDPREWQPHQTAEDASARHDIAASGSPDGNDQFSYSE